MLTDGTDDERRLKAQQRNAEEELLEKYGLLFGKALKEKKERQHQKRKYGRIEEDLRSWDTSLKKEQAIYARRCKRLCRK